jgi:hypothetical protein
MSDDKTYKVVRKFFADKEDEVVSTGLTLSEAREHCNDKESSSRTCPSKEGRALTRRFGEWFDAYYEEE